MGRRILGIALGVALTTAISAATVMAAGPSAPKNGHYANHGTPNPTKTYNHHVDFDVVSGHVKNVLHFDRCAVVQINWPKLRFRKGHFGFHGTVKDVIGSKFEVTFNGTALSKTKVAGTLKLKMLQSKAALVKNGCHTRTDYTAHRAGPIGTLGP
jgi:hypothetical protein